MTDHVIALSVNQRRHRLVTDANRTLLQVLREDLDLTGTKHGCDLGECGTCTVLLDGRPVLSCLTLAVQVGDRSVTTVEGLGDGDTPDSLQVAFGELGAAQCGYCTPAMLLSARALLDAVPDPDIDEINHALAGNLCRCTGYVKIREAVQLAASRDRE